MIKAIRKRFIKFLKGFLTEDDLQELSISMFSYGEDFPDSDVEDEIFNDLSGVENLTEYLRKTMNKDVSRYFSAASEANRNQVKGARSRTMYIYNRIRKANKGQSEAESKPKSLGMSRYMQ